MDGNTAPTELADFLFEVGKLAKTPRSGFDFLLSGKQSVAEHNNRTIFIAFTLAEKSIALGNDINLEKVLLMALFHDSTETRISDLSHVHQRYNVRKETEALNDQLANMVFGPKIKDLMREYKKQETLEAKLVKDADNLELICSLRELESSNRQSHVWIDNAFSRLKTSLAKKLGQAVQRVDPWHWWEKDRLKP